MRYAFMIAVIVLLVVPFREVRAQDHAAVHQGKYFCPMHPDYTSDRPGSCPICGMDLVARSQPAVPATGQGAAVLIHPDRQALAGVRVDNIRRRDLAVEVWAPATVAYDPELAAAQQSYLDSTSGAARDAVAGRLRVLGMSPGEIAALSARGAVQEGVAALEPGARAWVYLAVYEQDWPLMAEGQEVALRGAAGALFRGTVTGISPVLDSQSRSSRVRVRVEAPESALRPGMFLEARVRVPLGERLAVPAEAVLDPGGRCLVYVANADRFEPREVVLGVRAGEYYEVKGGLEPGEAVVVSGTFLVDSEARLKGVS